MEADIKGNLSTTKNNVLFRLRKSKKFLLVAFLVFNLGFVCFLGYKLQKMKTDEFNRSAQAQWAQCTTSQDCSWCGFLCVSSSIASRCRTTTGIPGFTCSCVEGTCKTIRSTTTPVTTAPASFDDSFTDSTWGTYKITVYHPTDTTNAPYPVVIFGHGSVASKDYYTWVGKFLSENGYIALLYTVPVTFGEGAHPYQWPAGFIGSINYLSEKNSTSGVLNGFVDETKIGISGHSNGSNGAMFAAAQDSRIKALVIFAPGYPVEDGQDPVLAQALRDASKYVNVPTQLQVGSLDGVVTPGGGSIHYSQLPTTKEYLEINGGNHVGFLDDGIIYTISLAFDNTPTITHDEQLRISREYLHAWFDYFLKGDLSNESALFGEEAQLDFTNGIFSDFAYVK